jgi:hypothetical protein
MAEQMRDVTADRADVRAFQFEPDEVAQLVESQRAIDGKFVLVDFAKLGFLAVELVLDVANDFLEDVLERHHADGAAVFIDHDGEVGVLRQEKVEEFLERHHFRHGN